MKILFGKVISCKMNKTVLVLIKKIKLIPIYNKQIKIFVKYYAHDDLNFCLKNDYIYIVNSKPYSKFKF